MSRVTKAQLEDQVAVLKAKNAELAAEKYDLHNANHRLSLNYEAAMHELAYAERQLDARWNPAYIGLAIGVMFGLIAGVVGMGVQS